MIALIDWILSLFRSEDAARAFVAAPEQAMRDAGLAGVSAAQLSSVAATGVPGLVLGGGDPILGLQRAVANQYGFAPAYIPQYAPSYDPVWNSSPSFAPAPTFAPETNTELASRNNTDLDVPLFSPRQDAGANAQQGAFNLGFGDITLGSKTTQTATNGGVVVGADANGDILSGDEAVLGDANAVTNGDIRADYGSNVSTGQDNVIRDSGTTAGAGRFGGFVDLPHGFRAFVPIGRTYDPDTGLGWEGRGVAPDIAVPADDALAAALAHLDSRPAGASTAPANP